MENADDFGLELDIQALAHAGRAEEARALLSRVLSQLVEAAGGEAGVMTARLSEGNEPTTSLYHVEEDESRHLVRMMESFTEESAALSPDNLAEVEQEARSRNHGKPLAIPVRSGGRAVGVFCLWHRTEAPSLLQESPGLVQLDLDELDVGLQGARLLERLLNERKWLEAVVQHSSDGVIIHDGKGRVMGYNLAMAKLSGWKLGEAVGEPSHEAFPLILAEPGSVFDETQETVSTALARPGTVPWVSATEAVEARLLARGGGNVDVEISGAPLFDRQGASLGWVMNVRDITRRKEMERLHKLFLSAVSHELQTPIAIIRGYAGLLADPDLKLDSKKVKQQANYIVEESQRLEQMVQQMLYATRIQAGGLKLQRLPLDVSSWLAELTEKFRPVAAARGVELVTGVLPPGLTVNADEEKLHQLVTNLMENATKYAGGRPVTISAHPVDRRWVRVDVRDGGPGIPQTERERIFSPFERGGDPLKQRVRGAGLGLYICKAIAEAHGGKIGVEGTPGGGATFFFTLPRER